MPATTQKPSGVSTDDKPRERPANVVTDETTVTLAPDSPTAASTAKPDDDKEPGSEGSDQTTDATAESEKNQPKKKSRRARQWERRLTKAQAALAEEQSKNEQNEARIAELEEQVESLASAAPKPKKPVLADFDDPDAFAEAYGKWKADSEKPASKKTPAKKPASNTDSRPAASQTELEEFHEAGVEKLGDKFLAAQKDESMAIDQVMGEFVLDSEVGPDLFVYLSEHPSEMREIFKETSTVEKVKLLQEIEAQIESGDVKPAQNKDDETDDKGEKARGADGRFKSKNASNAPAPGPDIDSGNVVPEKDLSKVGMDDYMATREAHYRKKGYR